MKNKKLLIIFLCFALFITSLWPVTMVQAGVVGTVLSGTAGCALVSFFSGGLGVIPCGIGAVLGIAGYFGGARWLSDHTAYIIASIIHWLAQGFHWLLFWVNNGLIAPIINILSQLNPFNDTVYKNPETGKIEPSPSPIGVLWKVLRNFAYIILVFSALAAGFEWLMGQDESAKRLIFNIIIVALLINFTFVLIEEAFSVVKALEDGITGGEGGKVGSIIANSLWQRDPFKEILTAIQNLPKSSDDKANDTSRYLTEILGYVFIIALDMGIFIILFVTALLFVVRYILLIFLAGVSPIAVASLTIPEFKGIRGLSEAFSVPRIFDTWLGHLVNWLLVVPIFIILVILGNVLTNNVLGQIPQTQTPQLIEFVILFLVLGGWYYMSLSVARKLSKGASEWAEKLAKTILAGMGLWLGKRLAFLGAPVVGSALTKAGDFMIRKVPVSRWTAWLAKPGMWAKRTGEEINKKFSEPMTELAESQMRLYREQLERAKDDKERAEAIKNMVNLIQGRYVKGNRYALEKVVNEMDRISKKDFEEIATNIEAISPLLSPDLPDEAIEKIRKKVTGLSDKTKLKILTDEKLLPVYQQATIKADFLEEIGKIDSDKMIEALSQAKPEIIQQIIMEDPETQSAVNKSMKGLASALVKGEAKLVANAISKLGEDILVNYKQLKEAVKKINPDFNVFEAIEELIQTETEMVLKAARKSTDDDLRNDLGQRWGDSEQFIKEHGLRPGTREYRLANQVLPRPGPRPAPSKPQQYKQLELPFDQQPEQS